jgi:hypothetical protein
MPTRWVWGIKRLALIFRLKHVVPSWFVFLLAVQFEAEIKRRGVFVRDGEPIACVSHRDKRKAGRVQAMVERDSVSHVILTV